MDKATFARLLDEVTVAARDFATQHVTNHLPDSCRYFVYLSQSFDGNPLKPGEQIYPDDTARSSERIGPLTASEVIELLWRDSLVPVWIDILVTATDSEHTFFELSCCGRFVADDALLYNTDHGQAPFGIKSPFLPPGWTEQSGRFDLKDSSKRILFRQNTAQKLCSPINSFWFATIIPALIGFGLAALCVKGFEFYGWSLFLGLPLAVCFMSAFCISYRREVPFWPTYWVSAFSLLLLGAFILLLALDGLMCLLMAFPLALGIGLIGTSFGRALGSSCSGGIRSTLPLLLVLLFPGLVAFDHTTTPAPPLRAVSTSVLINAPIERVWQTVIAFPKITEPPDGIFRCGIAYPIEARIEGSGVGAIRHCVFSTGSFIEPITHWEEPTLLAFDVSSSPPPMEELSLYEHIDAPHLHGHMVSHRGQFKIVQRGSQVFLEGTTWFTHTLSPQWYWGPISDYMIHRVHERVLHHIKRTSESR